MQRGLLNLSPTVSIIIPVYNVSAYLRQCLDSVLSQTYRNIEILLVDDGSTDDSGVICDAYAAQDARIKVIHKANGGLSDARNAGLERMAGEYVTFIDSDDYVNYKYVETLMDCVVSADSDLVIGAYIKFSDEAKLCPDMFAAEKGEMYLYGAREAAVRMLYRQIAMYAHGRLYHSRLFEQVRFPEGRFFEDIPTTWNILKRADKIVYIDSPVYYYRQRAGSIVRGCCTSRKMDQVYFTKDILDETRTDKILYEAAAFRYFFSLADVYTQMERDSRGSRRCREDRTFLEAEIKRYRGSVIRNKKGDIRIRGLAVLSYLSPEMVRISGRLYQKIHRLGKECKLK